MAQAQVAGQGSAASGQTFIPLPPECRYEPLRDLGSGNFGVAKLMRDKVTNEVLAVKFIERGERVDRNVEREICNHRMLNHPNIIRFKEVFLTPTHLGIVMEYAAGGELFERIVKAGRFSEDEARYFFQQLICGVEYCHISGVCHRDLKLENTLLDGNPAPRLKICDFGYSKSALDSQPKSTVGTPAYIAPEVLQRKEYNGQTADVWSCGVTLFVMLVGAYPFEDPQDPRNFRKTIQRIMGVQYVIPPALRISTECHDLLARIFVANPTQRITIPQIRRHQWFLRNLPAELANPNNFVRAPEPHQSIEEIRALVRAARTSGGGPKGGMEFNEDDYMDADMFDRAGGDGNGDGSGSNGMLSGGTYLYDPSGQGMQVQPRQGMVQHPGQQMTVAAQQQAMAMAMQQQQYYAAQAQAHAHAHAHAQMNSQAHAQAASAATAYGAQSYGGAYLHPSAAGATGVPRNMQQNQ